MSEQLLHARVSTPIAPLDVYVRGSAVCALGFGDRPERVQEELVRRFGQIRIEDARDPAGVVTCLARYFRGERHALDAIAVDPGGTEFQRRVWDELRRIPWGGTLAYSELACRVGRPRAVRAVGAANGRNPIAIVIPCHRVIGRDGTLTGYGGGLALKRWLLAHEGVVVPAEAPRRQAALPFA